MSDKDRKRLSNNVIKKENTNKVENDTSNAIKFARKQFFGDICIAIDAATFEEIRRLRKDAYKNIYPKMNLDNDILDHSAITLYTRNKKGEINSTARLVLDGPNGLPEDQFLSKYREEGKRLIEWGRFIIVDGNIDLLKKYYQSVFTIASNLNCDSIVMAMKPKDIPFHKRLTDIKIVTGDMKINYGGPYSLACVVWDIVNTKKAFFNWIGAKKLSAEHEIVDWDAYSESFQSVMPSEMLKLNKEVAQWLSGNVADFGCGGGKLIPFVLDQSHVTSYTGIDASIDMVKCASWMASQFQYKHCVIIQDKIESVSLQPMDSAVSINSYYTWPNPELVLSHIYNQLKENAIFVLATINPSINMPALLEVAKKELIAHPHWNEFKQHNLDICNSKNIRLVEMDYLVGQVRNIGFQLKETHTNLYGGGLNFLVLKKAG